MFLFLFYFWSMRESAYSSCTGGYTICIWAVSDASESSVCPKTPFALPVFGVGEDYSVSETILRWTMNVVLFRFFLFDCENIQENNTSNLYIFQWSIDVYSLYNSPTSRIFQMNAFGFVFFLLHIFFWFSFFSGKFFV